MLIKRTEIEPIKSLIQSLFKKKFDIKTQYKMIKVMKELEKEFDIYQEQVKITCEPYFERDEKGQPLMNQEGGFKIKKDLLDECYLAINQLNNLDIQIPDIYFSLDELECLDLTMEQLYILEPLIK